MRFDYEQEIRSDKSFLGLHISAILINIFYIGGILLSLVAYLNIANKFHLKYLLGGFRIIFFSSIFFILLTAYTNIIYKIRRKYNLVD